MREDLLQKLCIPLERLEEINSALFKPDQQVIYDFLDVVERYGTPEEINQKAQAARQLPVLYERVRQVHPEYLKTLIGCSSSVTRVPLFGFRIIAAKCWACRLIHWSLKPISAVTLEISACQYFPWLIDIARQAIERGEIMPGRYVRVRNMKEQEADGDLPAFAAAMQIIGAS